MHENPTHVRDKAILVVGMITDRVGLALLYIVFAPLVREIGLSENQFGVVIASANVTLGFASPWWGRRSQALGRRPVFVIGLSGYALGFLLLAMSLQAGQSGLLGGWSLFFVLVIVRMGYGLLAAATQPAATAYLADITDIGTRTKGMALIGMAAGIGTMLGPILGGSLSALGAVLPLYVAAALAAAAAALAFLGLREPVRHLKAAQPVRMPLLDKRVLPYLIGWCLVVLVLTGIQTISAFYLEDRFTLVSGEAVMQATSVAFLVMGIVMFVTQAVLLQVFRIAPVILLRVGFTLFTLALLVILWAPGLFMFYVAFGLMGFGFSAISPGLNAAASISVSSEEQGAVAGLLSAAPVVGMVFGPVICTALYGLDATWPIILGAVICAGLAIYFVAAKSRTSG